MIGLDLEIYPDPEIYLVKEDIGTTALESEETPALCPKLEVYLVKGIGTEVEETTAPCLDLEVYLGKGKGTAEIETLALAMTDIVA